MTITDRAREAHDEEARKAAEIRAAESAADATQADAYALTELFDHTRQLDQDVIIARTQADRHRRAVSLLLDQYKKPRSRLVRCRENAVRRADGTVDEDKVVEFLEAVLDEIAMESPEHILDRLNSDRSEVQVLTPAGHVADRLQHWADDRKARVAQLKAEAAAPVAVPPARAITEGQAALTMVEDSVRAAAVTLAGSTSPGLPGELEAPLESARPLPVREPHAKPSATKAPPVIPGGPEDTGAWTLRRADELHLADPAGVAAVITKGNPQGDITPQEAADRARIAADGMADTAVMAPVPAAVAPPAPAPDASIADQGPRTHAAPHPKAAKPGRVARLAAAVSGNNGGDGND